ncbi:hypothetical protein NE599_21375, partial [[Clostridium] symbiosum]|nr:hypothetical protein [[Clostridium] symbiosum]
YRSNQKVEKYYHYASLSEQAGTADDVFFLHGPADDDNNPSVEEAVECVKKFHPNVVILDNLLEHSVGMDEIATFKNMDEDIQVILMTAYASTAWDTEP